MSEVEKTKEILAVETECVPIVSEADSLKIDDEKGLETARNMVKDIRALMKKVEESYGPLKKSAHGTWKDIVAEENNQLSPLKLAKGAVEKTIGGYIEHVEEQARIAEEERLELRNKEIQKITKRIEKHLEGYKDLGEQIESLTTKLEEKRQASTLTDIEEEAIQNQLTILETKLNNKAETVERNQEAVEVAEIMPTRSSAPAVSLKGVGGGKKVKIPTVFNKEALIKFIAEGKAPIDLLEVNEGKLKKYVNDFPNCRLAGVSVQSKTKVVVR
jgi:chromosome segregation ATPase